MLLLKPAFSGLHKILADFRQRGAEIADGSPQPLQRGRDVAIVDDYLEEAAGHR